MTNFIGVKIAIIVIKF